jgi:hypothetical protein
MDELPESSFSGFMSNLEAQMKTLLSESTKAPSTMLEHLQSFTAAVDWTETWIRFLLAFHCICLFIAIFFERILIYREFSLVLSVPQFTSLNGLTHTAILIGQHSLNKITSIEPGFLLELCSLVPCFLYAYFNWYYLYLNSFTP